MTIKNVMDGQSNWINVQNMDAIWWRLFTAHLTSPAQW
jgi:hypothetical protein